MTNVIHSQLLEQRVLENLMHFGTHTHIRVKKAMLELSADCFYNPDNREIFSLIWDCFWKSEGFNFVDIMILTKGNAISYDTVNWITDNYRQLHVSDKGFEADVANLITLTQLRKQLSIAECMIAEVTACPSPGDASKLLNSHLTEINNLNFTKSRDGISSAELADSYLEGTMYADLKISTTCKQLNLALNGGITSKSLIIIAAGAGVGKTNFGIFLLDCIARSERGKQSLFFSLEMESKHIWMRHVGIRAGRQFDTIDPEKRMEAIGSALEVPMTIYDMASSRSVNDIDNLITIARLKAAEMPISVIVVDYLGLVDNRGNFEANHLRQADITTKLARLALELNCILIALSQINRNASSRSSDDRCPRPEDAADSSGGHRSSTLWIGVDRPELYRDEPEYINQFVVKCRKNRFGNPFELIFAFNNGTFGENFARQFAKPYAKAISFEDALISKN